MRVFAIDASGSSACYVSQMLEDAKRRSTGAKDMIVFFCSGYVSKTQLVKDATTDGIRSMGGDGLEDLFDWMEMRSLRPESELIIYHDGMFPPQVLADIQERWFTAKFIILTDSYNGKVIDQLDHAGLLLGTVALSALA